jgi:hypothetical protein
MASKSSATPSPVTAETPTACGGGARFKACDTVKSFVISTRAIFAQARAGLERGVELVEDHAHRAGQRVQVRLVLFGLRSRRAALRSMRRRITIVIAKGRRAPATAFFGLLCTTVNGYWSPFYNTTLSWRDHGPRLQRLLEGFVVAQPVEREAAGHCPGRKPPFWAIKHPARPYKGAIQNRFTVGNNKGA